MVKSVWFITAVGTCAILKECYQGQSFELLVCTSRDDIDLFFEIVYTHMRFWLTHTRNICLVFVLKGLKRLGISFLLD